MARKRKGGSPDWEFTSSFSVIGVDEVGAGPIAGPLVAAAATLKPGVAAADLDGVNDSKKMPPELREEMSKLIAAKCIWAVHKSTVQDIHLHGHNNAHQMAMARAAEECFRRAQEWDGWGRNGVLFVIDGQRTVRKLKDSGRMVTTLTKGDSRCLEVAAASIIAKQLRDKYMMEIAAKYPEYGFGKHKGYATEQHIKALVEYGPTPIHREKATETTLINWREKQNGK